MGAVIEALDYLLLPQRLGPRPWQQASYRAVARAVDNCSVGLCVLINVVGAYALSKYTAARVQGAGAKHGLRFVYIGMGVAQLVARQRWPGRYYRCRHYLLLWLRVSRVPILIIISGWTRAWLQSVDNEHDAVAYLGGNTPLSRPLVAVGSLLGFSGGTNTLMQVAEVPLPVVPQLVVQLVCLGILVVQQLEPAAASMQLTPFMPHLRAMCSGLNRAVVALYHACGGVYLQLPHLEAACHNNVARVMVLFVQLYVVLVLPVYYAYRLEQECRQRMQPAGVDGGQRGEADRDGGQERRIWDWNSVCWMGLLHAGALVLAGMLCWVAVLAAQPFLPLVVHPLAATL